MRDIPARDDRAAVVLHSALLDALILAASLPSSGTALAPTSFRPMVLVLGFSQQPMLLPSSAVSTCLLVQAPDILIASFVPGAITIPLPAAVPVR